MRWHFLRGQVPQDRSPKEIMWNSLEDSDDMWEHLFSSLVAEQDTGRIIYWGGHRRAYYRDNLCVEWVHSLKGTNFEAPDIIVARGGFKEYVPYLQKYPNAFKIYYGANHGCIPRDGIKYDMVWVDCKAQANLVSSIGLVPYIINKPAPSIFNILKYRKKWDCAFVAIHPNDKRKQVDWVYKTCPSSLKILQLGNYPKGIKVPKNVTVKKILHPNMPKALNKCKVLIAPYTGEDSGPRCITEAEACGVKTISLNDVKINTDNRACASKMNFWSVVKTMIQLNISPEATRLWYEDHIHNEGLREAIAQQRREKRQIL